MALWNKTGSMPKGLSKQDKRSVVVTDRGFEKLTVSGSRVKTEILVPLNGLTTTFPKPGPTDLWHEPAQDTIVLTALNGTVATTNTSATVTGTNTLFTTQLVVGNKIRIGGSTYRTVSAIANNTSLTVSVAATATTTGQAVSKFIANPVTTKISFAEPLTVAAPSRITINDVTANTTISAVAPATLSGGKNTLSFTWTPVYPGTYSVTTQTIANNTATAINIRSSNADTETANTVVSTTIAALGSFTLSNG